MSRQAIVTQYASILSRWPIDRLRPVERSFQDIVLRPRTEAAPAGPRDERREVQAAALLVDNAFSKHLPLSQSIMKPASNPTYYVDLERELEEVPHRTWFGRWMKRLQGIMKFR